MIISPNGTHQLSTSNSPTCPSHNYDKDPLVECTCAETNSKYEHASHRNKKYKELPLARRPGLLRSIYRRAWFRRLHSEMKTLIENMRREKDSIERRKVGACKRIFNEMFNQKSKLNQMAGGLVSWDSWKPKAMGVNRISNKVHTK